MKLEWNFIFEQIAWKAFFYAMAGLVTVISGLQIAERADFFKFFHHDGYGLPIRNSFTPDLSSMIQKADEQKPAKTIKVFKGTKYYFQKILIPSKDC